MQDALFPDDWSGEGSGKAPGKPPPREKPGQSAFVNPQPPDAEYTQLAAALPARARLGTSSWNYPRWSGLVWDGDYTETQLSRHGLGAYAKHPLFRTVSLDRAFYRPLTAQQYATYAALVGDDFRFVVKAPAPVTDPTVRGDQGQSVQANPAFLDAELAVREFVQPALDGLRHKLGALVFQISPLPAALRGRMPEVLARMSAMLKALPVLKEQAPDAVVAVEVRDALWLTPEFAAVLRDCGATYCMGLHAKMPPIEGQLPLLRALWPGPLVCRWNLHRMHGAFGYEDAADLYAPYDKLVDIDVETRTLLAKVVNATTKAGYNAYVTVSNKAEGCAPLSVAGLAYGICGQHPELKALNTLHQ
jgi:uncharacterized protein YecE (DUF72 family)